MCVYVSLPLSNCSYSVVLLYTRMPSSQIESQMRAVFICIQPANSSKLHMMQFEARPPFMVNVIRNLNFPFLGQYFRDKKRLWYNYASKNDQKQSRWYYFFDWNVLEFNIWSLEWTTSCPPMSSCEVDNQLSHQTHRARLEIKVGKLCRSCRKFSTNIYLLFANFILVTRLLYPFSRYMRRLHLWQCFLKVSVNPVSSVSLVPLIICVSLVGESVIPFSTLKPIFKMWALKFFQKFPVLFPPCVPCVPCLPHVPCATWSPVSPVPRPQRIFQLLKLAAFASPLLYDNSDGNDW